MAYTAPSGTIRTELDSTYNLGLELQWRVRRHGQDAEGNSYYEIAGSLYTYGEGSGPIDFAEVIIEPDTSSSTYQVYCAGETYSGGTLLGSFTAIRRHTTNNSDAIFSVQVRSFDSTSTDVDGIAVGIIETAGITLPAFKPYMTIASCPVKTIGNEVTISLLKKDANYTIDVYYELGAMSAEIAAGVTGGTCDWIIPDELHYEVTTSTRGTGYLITHTYAASGELVDTSYFPLVVLVDQEKCRPTLAPTAVFNQSTLTGDGNVVIPYHPYGSISYSTNAEAKYGATITKYLVRNSNIYMDTESGIINGGKDGLIHNGVYFSVTDSRGLIAHGEVVLDMVDYIAPTCHIQTEAAGSADSVKITLSGSYWSGNFGATDNALTLKYLYTWYGNSTGTQSVTIDASNISFDEENHTYTATVTQSGLDNTKQYDFYGAVNDKVYGTSYTVYSAHVDVILTPIFDWSQNDFNFNVPVAVQGDVDVNGNLDVSGTLSVNGTPILGEIETFKTGTWTPVCNCCSSPTYAFGNYMRVGQLVIINFYYQGTATDEDIFLYFSGLPFTPDSNYRWQSGGGNCSGWIPDDGSLVSGLTFTGWSIESGYIYGRTNKYGSTADTSVFNSSYITTAIGSTIYASGTIMYKIKDGE